MKEEKRNFNIHKRGYIIEKSLNENMLGLRIKIFDS